MHVLILMVNLSMVLWSMAATYQLYLDKETSWIPLNIFLTGYWIYILVKDINEANKTSWFL